MAYKAFIAAISAIFVLAGESSAATLTAGLTEGRNQSRDTVVGTTDVNVDSRRAEGVFDVGPLIPGDIFGIYGRIVGASDYFAFVIPHGARFEIALDLDGYDTFIRHDLQGAELHDDSNIRHVATSGLLNQSLLRPNARTEDPKQVVFRLNGVSGNVTETERWTNTVGAEADGLLFSGNAPGRYLLEITGMSRTPALYDLNVSVSQIPAPPGILLVSTALASFLVARRRKTSVQPAS